MEIKSNLELGQKLRKIRKAKGISQMKLAEKVGVSFQQIQKYEKGINKISVERLQQIAQALDTPIWLFLKEEPNRFAEEKESYEVGTLSEKEKMIIKLYRKIKSGKIKEGILLQLRGIIELEKKKN
ncbi:MAG: helix-turn-helix domain-containing protein [Candidatus Aminicenantia bacterium]